MRDNASDLDQFGVPVENILAAARRQAANQRQRAAFNTRVPTRKEVRHLPLNELKPLLLAWMENSPIEIVPSRGQIQLVMEVLQTRPDAADMAPLLSMCRNYSADA